MYLHKHLLVIKIVLLIWLFTKILTLHFSEVSVKYFLHKCGLEVPNHNSRECRHGFKTNRGTHQRMEEGEVRGLDICTE